MPYRTMSSYRIMHTKRPCCGDLENSGISPLSGCLDQSSICTLAFPCCTGIKRAGYFWRGHCAVALLPCCSYLNLLSSQQTSPPSSACHKSLTKAVSQPLDLCSNMSGENSFRGSNHSVTCGRGGHKTSGL